MSIAKSQWQHMLFRVLALVIIASSTAMAEIYTIDISNSGCNAWEPGGYCTNQNYTVTLENRNDIYYYTYTNNDGLGLNFSYYLDTSLNTCRLSIVRYNVTVNGKNYDGRIANGYSSFNYTGINQASYDVSTSLINHTIINNSSVQCIVKTYNATTGDYFLETDIYSVSGKALVVDVSISGINETTDYSRYDSHLLDTASTTPKYKQYQFGLTTDDFADFVLVDNTIFINAYHDVITSNGSRFNYFGVSAYNEYSTEWNKGSEYYTLSDGTKNKPHEKVFLIMSDKWKDVERTIPQNTTPFKDALYGKVMLEKWTNGYTLGEQGSDALAEQYIDKYLNYGFTGLIYNLQTWILNASHPQNVKNKDVDVLVYRIQQDIYDFDDPGYYNTGNLMQYADGTPIVCYTSGSNTAYCSKYELRLNLSKINMASRFSIPYVSAMNVSGLFHDTVVANGLSKGPDRNASSQQRGIRWNGFQPMLDLINYYKQNTSGYEFVEGPSTNKDFVPYVDGYENERTCCNNYLTKSPFSEIDLTYITPYKFIYGGYYRRAMPMNNDDDQKYGQENFTQTMYDTYFVYHHGIRGDQCMIDGPFPWTHNISDRYVINYYYMCKELAKNYYYMNASQTTVKYYDSITDTWRDFDNITKSYNTTFNYVNMTTWINYSTGLQVYSCLNGPNVTIDGYNLVNQSMYAKNGTLVFLYNINNQYFVRSSEYVYSLSKDGTVKNVSLGANLYDLYNFTIPVDNKINTSAGKKLVATATYIYNSSDQVLLTETEAEPPVFTQDVSNISIFVNQTVEIQINATDTDNISLIWEINDSIISINQTGYINDSSHTNASIGNWSIRVNVSDGINVANMTFNYEVKNISSNETASFCGDSTCDANETCSICSIDCGVCPSAASSSSSKGGSSIIVARYCGDGICTETCRTCEKDCGICPSAPIIPAPAKNITTEQPSPIAYPPGTISLYSEMSEIKIKLNNLSRSYSLYGYSNQTWTELVYSVQESILRYSGKSYPKYALAVSNTHPAAIMFAMLEQPHQPIKIPPSIIHILLASVILIAGLIKYKQTRSRRKLSTTSPLKKSQSSQK